MEIIAAIPAFSVILHTAGRAFPPASETIKTGQDEKSENYGPPQNVQRGLGQGIRRGRTTALPDAPRRTGVLNPTDFATRLGKRFTNMYLRWPTAQRKNRSTTAIG